MVSIIVPIYNSVKYLSRCIESLMNQSYQNIEILLVDDGSTDDTSVVCREYSKIDSRIRYIKKKNGGVSSARNEGIRNAKGEYITFVDSDDYLDRNIISFAVKKINETKSDIIGWNAWIVNENGIKKSKDIKYSQNDFGYIQAAIISNYTNEFYCGDYIRAVWGKLFKKSVIDENNILFNEKLYIGEDAVFLMDYISHAQKASLINTYGYYYRILSNSAVRRYKSDLYQQSMLQMRLMKNFFRTSDIDDIIKDSLCVLQWTLLHDLLQNARSSKKKWIDYSDVYKWYTYMQNSQIGQKRKAPWAGKLVQIQMCLGTKFPICMQVMIMRMYDMMRSIMGK